MVSEGIQLEICGIHQEKTNMPLKVCQTHNLQNRCFAIVENGSWAPSAGKAMKALLEPMKNVWIVEPMVTIKSSMKEADIPQLEALADALLSE